MPYAYYSRLSAAQKRIYRRSDGIATIELPRSDRLRVPTEQLAAALKAERRGDVEGLCQELADGICRRLDLAPVQLRVLAKRPSRSWGELHGLYELATEEEPATITLWMRTAQRKQVVAFRTFLRTLLHELCHHLDYELLELEDSFHTEGFFQRESSLFRSLMGETRPTESDPSAEEILP